MKTKELIRRIELMGYRAEELKSIGEVRIFHNGYLCATVDTDYFLSLDTLHGNFHELDEYKQEALYNILDQYARTPVDERVEEEKYYYRIPGVVKRESYINLRSDDNELKISSIFETSIFKTQFTQSDIDKLTPNQQSLFAIAIKERVDE